MKFKCNEVEESLKLAKEFLEENGYMTFKKQDIPTMTEVMMKERVEHEKEKSLAFVIFDIVDQRKVNVRKIYYDGHIEGFEGNPIIVNHAFPKLNALKYLAQSINEEYRNLIRRFTLSDFYPMETVNKLYKKNKETIEKI